MNSDIISNTSRHPICAEKLILHTFNFSNKTSSLSSTVEVMLFTVACHQGIDCLQMRFGYPLHAIESSSIFSHEFEISNYQFALFTNGLIDRFQGMVVFSFTVMYPCLVHAKRDVRCKIKKFRFLIKNE